MLKYIYILKIFEKIKKPEKSWVLKNDTYKQKPKN